MAKKGSVLICDDEEIMRDVLETILSSAGYRADLAKTGEEAIEAFAQKSYDVVLMDVSMPGMGGLTALEEIIKMDSEAVVLMITAYATFDTAISAWEKGATGIIRKPFQNEQIAARGVNFYGEVRRFEIDLIRRALEQTGGHQSRAARLLGLNATTLNYKIKTYNIPIWL